VKKLLHEPTVRLRARAGAGEADEAAAAIRELFDLSAPRDP
jgi:glutamyl-tRNA reductase